MMMEYDGLGRPAGWKSFGGVVKSANRVRVIQVLTINNLVELRIIQQRSMLLLTAYSSTNPKSNKT